MPPRFIPNAETPDAPVPIPTAPRQGAPLARIQIDPTDYPSIRRDHVVETLHGQVIADPYRWLEDPDSTETAQFVAAQNELWSRVKNQCASRDSFRALFEKVYNYAKYSTPSRIRPGRYVFSHNSGLLNQYVVQLLDTDPADLTCGMNHNDSDQGSNGMKSVDAKRRVLLDPNLLSEDGTVALGSMAWTHEGDFVAYMLSKAGSDWQTIHLLHVADNGTVTKREGEVLEHVKFSSLAWTKDGCGFFYNRYDPPSSTIELGTETAANKNQLLCYHALGTQQADDVVLLAFPDHPDWMMGASVTEDGAYLLVTVSEGCVPANQLHICDLRTLSKLNNNNNNNKKNGGGGIDFKPYHVDATTSPKPTLPLTPIVSNFIATWDVVANDDNVFTLQTNYKASRQRLVRFTLAPNADSTTATTTTTTTTATTTLYDPDAFTEVLPEHPEHVLSYAVALKGDRMITCYMVDVADQLQIRSLSTGALLTTMRDVPPCASIGSCRGRREDTDFFFSITSFVNASTIYHCDVSDPLQPIVKPWYNASPGGVDTTQFVTKQVFVESHDGVQVPMFIIHHKDLVLHDTKDAKDVVLPCLLYGYGGFNISLRPSFRASALAWLLAYGGVFALANLRGGGEYGRAWRDDGSLFRKQNVFHDFAACANHLLTHGYATHIAAEGGSNGGLLVAATLQQRPDLFAAGLAHVGVLDMLRFHKFTIGVAWVTDYGHPDKKDEFDYLLSYSPLHNVRQPELGSRQAPALLVTTADHDDRVVPLHSFKFIAETQYQLARRFIESNHTDNNTNNTTNEACVQRNPLLIRVEVKAGHGAGKPLSKVLDEVADCYAFAAGVMGAKWTYKG